MTKNQIVEQIKTTMPQIDDQDPQKQIKIALHIYISLGKIKSFDERYYFGNSETKRKIYNLSQKEKDNKEKMSERKKLVCVGLSHLYRIILEEFGIKAEVIRPDPDDLHELTIVYPQKGMLVETDLQEDLHNIKTRKRLKNFALEDELIQKNSTQISQEEIDIMCKQIGYIDEENGFKNEEIEALKQSSKNMNAHELLEEILTSEKLSIDDDTQFYELYRYYLELIKEVVSDKSKNKINYFTCYRESPDEIDEETNAKKREYTICAYSVEKETVKAYMYSRKSGKFLPIQLDKISELEKQGLVLGTRKNEKGVNLLRRYIKREEQLEK